jgi:Flp pilus assembly protein TadG
MRQAIRNFLVGSDGEEGAALLEFTIFAPIIIVLILGVVDFGLYIYRNVQVQNAAQAGAEYAIAHGFSAASISSAVTNAACYPSGSCVFTSTITVPSGSPSRFCGCPSNTGVTQIAAGACTAGMLCSGGSSPGTYVNVQAQAAYSTTLPSVLSPSPLLLTFANTTVCPAGANIICATATVRVQ